MLIPFKAIPSRVLVTVSCKSV